MKKTIYLHIGTHKTASSSIQAYLNVNRDRLARQGYSYVGKCTRSTGAVIMPELAAAIDRFASDAGLHSLIISDEDLSHNADDITLDWITSYKDQYHVVVICFVRELISYYLSFYCYASVYFAASSIAPSYAGLARYAKRQQAYEFNAKLIESLLSTLGRKSVHVVPFEQSRFRAGIIENTMCDVLGCDNRDFQPIDVQNKSPNRLQAEAIYRVLNWTTDPSVRQKMVEYVMKSEFLTRYSVQITEDEVYAIVSRYGGCQKRLVELFGLGNHPDDVFSSSAAGWLLKAGSPGTHYLDDNDERMLREFFDSLSCIRQEIPASNSMKLLRAMRRLFIQRSCQ